MRRTKTMLMGDLLEEFFKRPYVAAKVAEGKPVSYTHLTLPTNSLV